MDCVKERTPESIEDTLTYTVASDLKNLLSTIKGRTILMKNIVTPSNPLQSHFDEILHCIKESSDITNLLLHPPRH